MNALHKRARAEEAFFVNRQTETFLAQASGLRRLGEWAAEHMMDEDAPAVAAYADALVRAGVVGEDACRTVNECFAMNGVAIAPEEVSSRFDAFLTEARQARNI